MKTGTGVKLYIGTTAAASTLQDFQGDDYDEVGDVQEIGEFGDQRNVVTFAALNDGRVRKARGTADAGDVPVVYAHMTGDDGQDALKAAYEVASQSADEFNFKIELNDSLGSNPTTFFFRAKITSRRVQSISNDGVVLVQSTLAINSPVLELEAA